MKKFIPFLLSALLVLSLAACESNGDARSTASESSAGSTASSEAESSAAATEEATATPEPTEEPSAQPTLEETVLLDEGGIKVTATGLTDYGLGGAPDLELHVENNTDGDIMVQTSEYAAVNGCMVRGIASIQASAGDSADDTVKTLDFKANGAVTQCSLNAELLAGTRQFTELRLDADSCTQNGITELKDLSFYFSVCDLMTWNEITKSDTVTLEF